MSTKKIQLLNSTIKEARNADTLDGMHADEFATPKYVDAKISEIDLTGYAIDIDLTGSNSGVINPVNADTLGGQLPEYYATVEQMPKAAPRNLLDNSDFRNPVNQRGNATYTTANVTIDRWGLAVNRTGAYAAIDTTRGKFLFLNSSDGLVIYFYQRFVKGILNEQKKYTAAWMTSDEVIHIGNTGTVNISFASTAYDQVVFNLPAPSEIVWIALYEGEYTLETLPEYQPKGYGAELAECQRYYCNSWFGRTGGKNGPMQYFGFPFNNTTADCGPIMFPQMMRALPTMLYYGSAGRVSPSVYTDVYHLVPQTTTLDRLGLYGVYVRVTKEASDTSTWPVGGALQFHAHWEASADL